MDRGRNIPQYGFILKTFAWRSSMGPSIINKSIIPPPHPFTPDEELFKGSSSDLMTNIEDYSHK